MARGYPVTLTLPIDTLACTQAWEYVTENGKRRIKTTYNTPFTLACALLVSEVMTAEEIMEVMNGTEAT